MVKVSGQWLSPTEVANVRLEHPAVLECAVVIGRSQNGLNCATADATLHQAASAIMTLHKLCKPVRSGTSRHTKTRESLVAVRSS